MWLGFVQIYNIKKKNKSFPLRTSFARNSILSFEIVEILLSFAEKLFCHRIISNGTNNWNSLLNFLHCNSLLNVKRATTKPRSYVVL